MLIKDLYFNKKYVFNFQLLLDVLQNCVIKKILVVPMGKDVFLKTKFVMTIPTVWMEVMKTLICAR